MDEIFYYHLFQFSVTTGCLYQELNAGIISFYLAHQVVGQVG